jgi:hypothetical protein
MPPNFIAQLGGIEILHYLIQLLLLNHQTLDLLHHNQPSHQNLSL